MAIKILIGGSPCTHWSIAQTQNRETQAEGIGWELFKNYLIAKEKFKPDFFLYENNKSAAQAIKDQIATELGVGVDTQARFTYINSSLVSAQNRQRFYVTNFGDIEQPKDRGILLKDIIIPERNRTDMRELGNWVYGKWGDTLRLDRLKPLTSDKANCLTTSKTHTEQYYLSADKTKYCNLTIEEWEQLQTMPIGYTKSVKSTERYRGLGNGWTAEVIIHLLNHALKDVPRDEEIIVLSLYDGIGTGRYCLDKMGFTNVKYHAYEIDRHPIAIATDNYPDIIQHGDAFAVREEEWKAPQSSSQWLDELLGG